MPKGRLLEANRPAAYGDGRRQAMTERLSAA